MAEPHAGAPEPHRLLRQIWARDAAAWGPGDDDPADRLGWLDLPRSMEREVEPLMGWANEVKSAGYDRVVLLGMGGSSFAPEVFAGTLAGAGGLPLSVGDSTHPDQVRALRTELEGTRPLFLVSSKSGGTLETISLYRYFREIYVDGTSFVSITDPGSSLEELSRKESFRRCFTNPPDIGGRYSGLSLFGLVPAALLGVDLEALLGHAARMADTCGPQSEPEQNPALMIGISLALLAQRGKDKLTFLISDAIAPLGDWLEQLIAESTGKHGKGIVPVVGEPRLDPDMYRGDRVFAFISLDAGSGSGSTKRGDEATSDANFVGVLKERGHPIVHTRLASPDALGAEMWRWEFITAVAGAALGINAFDQPDVEAAKRAARSVLDGIATTGFVPTDPAEFFDDLAEGDLAALLAFLPYAGETDEVLARARRRLAEGGVATTSGYGPRYLHSTGQLHKGGPKNVHALVIVSDELRDEPVPGASYGFAALVSAQAAGDVQALDEAEQRVAVTNWTVFKRWVESGSR